MPGMPRENEPSHDDVDRGVRDTSKHESMRKGKQKAKARRKQQSQHPHTETKREATERLGETSDQYGHREERDPRTDMTEGEDIARTIPDVVTESPSGMGADTPSEVNKGFRDDRERRD